MALINRFNFIVWSTVPPEPVHLSNLPMGAPVGRSSSCVLMVPGELTTFYINAPDGLTLPSFTIDVVHPVSLAPILTNIGEVTRIEVEGLANPQYYGFITTPTAPVLKQDYYRLRIGSVGTYIYSNRLWYRPTDYTTISAYMSFRNADDLANIPYELESVVGFRNKMRIKCFAGLSQTDSDIEDYKAVTTGRRRIVSNVQSVYYPFTSVNVDALGAEGFRAMLNHKDLLVNGNPMSLKTPFNLSSEGLLLGDGTFELWDTAFALVTQC